MALVKEVGDIESNTRRFGGKVQMLKLDMLEVDQRFQRPLNQRRVDRMTEAFDSQLVGLLTVSQRKNGKYVLLDGQHRWLLLVNKGFTSAMCEVLEGLALEDEATIFHGRNVGRARLTRGDHFRAKVIAGDPAAIATDKLVRAAGFTLDLAPSANWRRSGAADPRVIISVSAVERLYGLGVLGKTLTVIRQSWPQEKAFFMKHDLLLGVGAFLRAYPEVQDDLADVVRKLSNATPQNIWAAAQVRNAYVTKDSAWQRVMETLRIVYNRNRKTGRLAQRENAISAMTRYGKEAKPSTKPRARSRGKFAAKAVA